MNDGKISTAYTCFSSLLMVLNKYKLSEMHTCNANSKRIKAKKKKSELKLKTTRNDCVILFDGSFVKLKRKML